ncbi:MAG TPA: hypothetical protein PKH24_10160 [Sedimentisphaerales bacterium]|jgi:uncharacterized iron-regulated membrane protein|nr:hypothetical protein [Phycisphaerae bacterium]HNS20853.1 hypothetical protein [Sedimentisphaerales bacterium]HNU29466.1 hypothetical protein [Sedimentisphaerales bacterium]
MALAGVVVSVWVLSGVLAYFATEAAVRHSERQVWDRTTRECALACSVVLGPFFLVISVELLLFALIGEGLAHDRMRHYKDS